MRWSAPLPRILVLGTSLWFLAACQSPAYRFLSLIGVAKEPVMVALVADRPTGTPASALALLNPFAPYDRLQAVLTKGLGRPVGWDLCFPIQLESSLTTGICHLAILTPVEYARLPQRERFNVVAVPVDEGGQVARPALLVVANNAPIQSVVELRGKTIAFGPAEDSRTHYAALELLAQHGLQKADLSLELLPLPGSLKHMPNGRAVAQTVLNASSDAGFLDELAWEALPEHSDRADEPARDRLRIVDRTIALPEKLLLSSPKLDGATTEKVRSLLVSAAHEHPEALAPLHISGYQDPTPEVLAACQRLTGVASGAAKPAEQPTP